jgi:arylsulfatase A
VGSLIAKLDQLGIRENTLVIFTADNGTDSRISSTFADGRKIRGGKGSMNDAGTMVPYLVSLPGSIKPGRSKALTDLSDVYPTLAELNGIAPGNVDGFSQWPIFRREKESIRDWIYVEESSRFFIRSQRYALHGGAGKQGLYDVSDVYNHVRIDVDADSGSTEKPRARLRAQLDRIRAPAP